MTVSFKSLAGTAELRSKRMKVPTIEFIAEAGLCIASQRVVSQSDTVRWMIREDSKFDSDNGWRIFSRSDTDEYLSDPANLAKVDFNQLCVIEPLLIGIWELPVGSRLQIVNDELGKRIVDTPTGREIPQKDLYVPPAQRAD